MFTVHPGSTSTTTRCLPGTPISPTGLRPQRWHARPGRRTGSRAGTWARMILVAGDGPDRPQGDAAQSDAEGIWAESENVSRRPLLRMASPLAPAAAFSPSSLSTGRSSTRALARGWSVVMRISIVSIGRKVSFGRAAGLARIAHVHARIAQSPPEAGVRTPFRPSRARREAEAARGATPEQRQARPCQTLSNIL
jgi:hypothetical protein